MEIIPAIDIIDGKCVRLQKGNYDEKTVYSENPVEVARMFENEGLTRLHIVDLDGARAGALKNLDVLEDIANCTEMVIDFGGGIKTISDASNVWNAGADFITLGSLAVNDPETVKELIGIYGAKQILIGADVLDEVIMIHGWQKNTGIKILDFIKDLNKAGIENFFCTDISKDGMLEGCSVELYEKIIREFPQIHLIASGGVTTLQDLQTLKNTGCSGAIIGKALYEGTISLHELSMFNL